MTQVIETMSRILPSVPHFVSFLIRLRLVVPRNLITASQMSGSDESVPHVVQWVTLFFAIFWCFETSFAYNDRQPCSCMTFACMCTCAHPGFHNFPSIHPFIHSSFRRRRPLRTDDSLSLPLHPLPHPLRNIHHPLPPFSSRCPTSGRDSQKTLSHASHLRLHDARDVMVGVLRECDEDVV